MKKDEAPRRSPGPGNSAAGGPAAAETENDSPSFEQAIKRLEEIVDRLESGELPLDESLKLFEEGIGLSRRAGVLLDLAERKVEALTRAAGGRLDVVAFESSLSVEEGEAEE